MKRKLILILFAVLAIAALSVVSANMTMVSAATYSGSCGDNVRWNLDTFTGVLTISGSGSMSDYNYDIYNHTFATAPWNQYCSSIKKIMVTFGVTSIGNRAFKGCTRLTSITIPDTVTSIGEYAFCDCTGLTSIAIGDSVTSIGAGAFNGCNGLTSISLPFTGASVDAYGYTGVFGWIFGYFYDTNRNDYQTYPSSFVFRRSGNVPDGTTWQYSFYQSDGFAERAYLESYYYYIPTSLKTVIISGEKIKNYAFINCNQLKEVIIDDSVTSIEEYAFYGCTGIQSVTISEQLSIINEYAFYNCQNLEDVIFPETVISVGDYALEGTKWVCNQPNGVVYVGKVVYKNKDKYLSDLTLKEGTTEIALMAFSDCTGLTEITIPDSVTSIGESAFRGCTGLTEITIPDSVTSIGENAFRGCTGLTSISLPFLGASPFNGGTKAVFGYIFGYTTEKKFSGLSSYPSGFVGNNASTTPEGTTWQYSYYTEEKHSVYLYSYYYYIPDSLKSVTITGKRISDYAFNNCAGLTSITISDSVESIGEHAFYNCTGLTSIAIGDSVTSIGARAFSGCTELTNVNINNIATWCGISFENRYANPLYYAHNLYLNGELIIDLVIPDSVTSIGNYAFSGCTGLTSITIPDSVTSIGNYAFSGCTGLTSITIGNAVTSIGGYAFSGCTGLTSITIPDSVTSIGDRAFYDCKGLTSITIPSSVTSIGDSAFYGCMGLTTLYLSDGISNVGKSFSGSAYVLIKPNTNTTENTLKNANVPYYYYDGNLIFTVSDENATITGLIDNTAETVELPQTVDGFTVTSIGNSAFYDCTGLTSITIPSSVKSIGSGAFSGCSSLTEITVPFVGASASASDFNGVFGYIFGYSMQYNSNDYNYSSSSTDFVNRNASTTPDGTTWQYSCYNRNTNGRYYLQSYYYNIPSSLKKVTVTGGAIRENAFFNCSELETVVLCDGVTGIGERAFENCTGLTSITIPDSVTSVGLEAFSGCTGLTSVLIGDSVSEIGSSAFSGFTGWANTKNNAYAQSYFKSKNIKSTVSYGSENYWGYDPAAKTLYVFGSGRTENYKNVTSTPWTSFATEVKKIVIDDGIEYIGNFSFRNFTSLDYLEKSDGVEFGYNALPDGFKAVNSAVPISPEISWVTENTVELKAVDGYEYRRGSGSWQTSNVFTGLWEGYSYSFSQRIAETDQYRPSAESASVSVTTVTSPSSVSMTSFTEEALTLSPVGRGEYSLDLVHWQASNVITDFPKNETFRVWVRIAGTSARKASAPASPVTFVYLTGPEFVEYIDETLRIKEYPGVRCEYSNDNVNWQSESVFTGIPKGVDLDIYIRPVDRSVIYAGGVREFHGEHNDVYETEAILDEALYKVKKCSDCGVILEKTFIKSVFVYGDATGDGVVTAADIVRLKKYVASGNTLAVGKGADANGDGVVDSLDVVRLKNYFASYDYDKKTSPIKLGAQN